MTIITILLVILMAGAFGTVGHDIRSRQNKKSIRPWDLKIGWRQCQEDILSLEDKYLEEANLEII